MLCLNCGITGVMSLHDDDNDAVPQDRLFKRTEHELCHGDSHYQCPVCKINLFFNAKEVLEEDFLKGYPSWLADARIRQRKSYKSTQKAMIQSSIEKLRTTSPTHMIMSFIMLTIGGLSFFIGLKDATAEIALSPSPNAITRLYGGLPILNNKSK